MPVAHLGDRADHDWDDFAVQRDVDVGGSSAEPIGGWFVCIVQPLAQSGERVRGLRPAVLATEATASGANGDDPHRQRPGQTVPDGLRSSILHLGTRSGGP